MAGQISERGLGPRCGVGGLIHLFASALLTPVVNIGAPAHPLWNLAHPGGGAPTLESAAKPSLSDHLLEPRVGVDGGTGIGFQSDKAPPSWGTAGQISQAGHIYNSTVSMRRVEEGGQGLARFISLIVTLTGLGVRCHGPWGM